MLNVVTKLKNSSNSATDIYGEKW